MALPVAVQSAAAAEAGCLFVNGNPAAYGDRSITNVTWGDAYPTVSVTFVTQPDIVFAPADGGGSKQQFGNNRLTPGTTALDEPAFISVYTNDLRLNALIADTGTVVLTYTFSTPMMLVDVIVADVDQGDSVQVSATAPGGAPLAPGVFQKMGEGDLSLTINAGGRPPLELATPPIWNEITGVLTAAVSWNENRSFTILRNPEGVAVESVTLSFKGASTDTDGPLGSGLGGHVYAALWASPRSHQITSFGPTSGNLALAVPTLPGYADLILESDDLSTWTEVSTFSGAGVPTGTRPRCPPRRAAP